MGGDRVHRRLRLSRLALVALLLAGCVRNIPECQEPDLAAFARGVDETVALAGAGKIDNEMASDLLAIDALRLRRALRRGCR